MKKAIPIHPPLIALFPVLALYSANLGMFDLEDLWMPLFFYGGFAVFAWVSSALIWRNATKGAMAASTLVVAWIAYGQVFHGGVPVFVQAVWMAAALGLAGVVSWKWNGTAILNALGVFLLLSSSGSIAYRLYVARAKATAGQLPVSGSIAGPSSPDVYYIILDGYGRHDSLLKFLDYSNQNFIDALRKRGFYVATESRSNYVQTEISIPSSLNMNFIPTLVPDIDRSATERSTLDLLGKSNETSRQFKARGYQTAVVTTGFPPFDHLPADEVYRGRTNQTLFESTLSQQSPIANDANDTAMYDQRRNQLLDAFKNLKKIAGRRATPRFVFVHILAPHPPFVFDAKGRPIRPKYPFGLWDGSDFIIAGSTREAYKTGYSGQVETINRMVLDAIDTLQSKPGLKPLIILQGDHGSKRFLDQNSLEKTDIRECFSNLVAVAGPDSVTQKFYPSISPVNELRVVFNGLFNANYPLLPDRSWYSPYDHPYRFTEVTKQEDEFTRESVRP